MSRHNHRWGALTPMDTDPDLWAEDRAAEIIDVVNLARIACGDEPITEAQLVRELLDAARKSREEDEEYYG